MDQQQTIEKPKNRQLIIGIVAIALIALVAVGVYAAQPMNEKRTSVPAKDTTVSPILQETPADVDMQSANYKDGTYSVVGNYISPGGAEELGVEVTLENGLITKIDVTPRATRPISKTRQEDFAAHYKPFVEGKNIDEVQLSKVSGSSLSPKGFNDAIEKIRSQARA